MPGAPPLEKKLLVRKKDLSPLELNTEENPYKSYTKEQKRTDKDCRL